MSGDFTRNVVHGDAGTVIQAHEVHLHAAPRTPTPRQLPPDVTHFTGRDAELTALDALLDTDTRPVVISAIAGVGGVGKTSLALHWAHRVRDRFPDGQLYANLRGFSPEPPMPQAQVLTGFLTALGVSGTTVPQDLDSMAALYRSLLADRHVLVVLDNAATAAQVRPLLPGSARSLVLVTSRNRLPGLVARDGAHRITVRGLSSRNALALLQKVVGAARIDAEQEAVGTLVRQCAGLPLALRIAAERVADRPHRTVGDLTADLAGHRLDALASADDSTTAVRTVFAWSYEALPVRAAEVFRRLSLHPGPTITVHAAAAVSGLTPAAVRPVLEVLTGGHLLEEIGRDRFRFHDLVREYAAETTRALDPAEKREEAVRRLFDWYLHTADVARLITYPFHADPPFEHPPAALEPLRFDSRRAALEWVRQEHTNLLSILQYAAAHDHHRIAALLPACLLMPYMLIGQWEPEVRACTIGLASARRLGDEQIELIALGSLTDALLETSQLDEALRLLRETLEVALRTGNRRKIASAHHETAVVLYRRGHLDEADGYFQEALRLYRDLGMRRGEAMVLGMLGEISRLRQRFEDAREQLNQALEILRETGNTWKEALFLRYLSLLCADLGELDEAACHLERSAATYSELEFVDESARTLRMLGDVLSRRGDHDRAARVRAEALAIFDSIHAPEADELRAVIAAQPPAP